MEESFIEKSNSDLNIQSQTESVSISETESESKPITDIITTDGMVFTPHNLNKGWLFELSGGEAMEVFVADDETLHDQKYIDITGKNGHVRYYLNSFAADEFNLKNTISQFWSAKQKVGNSIKKDFTGEIRTVVLFEKPDGSKYLYGYVESDNIDFLLADLLLTDYFSFNEPNN